MKRFELFFLLIQIPVDLLMLLFAGGTAYVVRQSAWMQGWRPVLFDMSLGEFLFLLIPIAIASLIIFTFAGLYNRDPNRRFARDILRIIFACSAAAMAVILLIFFQHTLFDSRFLFLATWVFAMGYMMLGRLILHGVKLWLHARGMGMRRVLLIGENETAAQLKTLFAKELRLGYHVVKQTAVFHKHDWKEYEQLKLDEVILAEPKKDDEGTEAALDFATAMHLPVKYAADMFATRSSNMGIHPLGGIPMVSLHPTRLQGWGVIVKRCFDIFVSATCLFLFSPVFVCTALAVYVETGRPLIYHNTRVGKRGKQFTTFKFRSMYQDDCTGEQFGDGGKKALEKEAALIAQQNSKEGPIYKVADDPRVTKVGHVIRRFSLDELPQFWNVLLGHMSIVGPRPHQPREVAGYDKAHHRAFAVKPGITGLAQISGRSDLTYEEEMRLDILYIERWSLWLDIIICIKTPFVVFKRRKVV